ncbi:MAG: ABC transporter substrate-binding protein [Spirochaeta sp.]|jgi:taurine transport system substrate-binding protein|nr:ABC transporter substrate-binding protein [Spirochaeta sp.]
MMKHIWLGASGARIALFCVLVLATGLTTVTASGNREPQELKEVVIGFQAIPNGEIVAKARGRHEATLGVPVKWVQFNSGSELNSAVAAGSVHLGLGGSSTTVAAIAQGVPADVIWIYDIIGDNEALVVRDGSGIESLSDLEGRRVGVPFGATTHYHLLVAFDLYGVDSSQVEVLDLAPSDMRAAWQRGDIDAGFVWEPTLAAMLDMGGSVLVSSRTIAEAGFLTGDIGIVHREFAELHPDIVVEYLRNQMWAVDLIANNPESAAASVAEELGLSADEALRQMSTLVFLSGTEQLGSAYLGTRNDPGALADVFLETALFLEEQDTIRAAPDLAVFQEAIRPEFLEQAVAPDGE